jgi:hypothetical protein
VDRGGTEGYGGGVCRAMLGEDGDSGEAFFEGVEACGREIS